MAFFGKDKGTEHRVGAREKRERALAIKRGGSDEIQSRREGEGKKSDAHMVLMVIYGMAVVLALLLGQGPIAEGKVALRLPHPGLQAWLLGRTPPAVLGDPDLDMVIASFVRGAVIFALASVVPLLALGFCKALRIARPTLAVFWFVSLLLLGGALLALAA